jgi:tRNA (adenine37-N6)-methyltransferase
MNDELTLETIGVIETPFDQPTGTPIQPSRSAAASGTVRIDARYHAALKDLEGFERIWLLYWFHRAPEPRLRVTPFLDDQERGVFATRAPARPCPIGMSVVRLLRVLDGGVLEVAGIDVVNGTPLLDIKPYVPEFDSYPASAAGWLDETTSKRRLADERFRQG